MYHDTANSFFLGATRDFCNRTDLSHAIRELATNAIDADPTLTLTDAVRVSEKYGEVQAIIANKSKRGLKPDDLLQGPSDKKDDDRFFGGFGCGLKDALAIFVREGIAVEIMTRVWCGELCEAVRPCANPQFQTTKKEVCVLHRNAEDADRDRLDAMQGAAVAFLLKGPAKLRKAVNDCNLGDLAQYESAPQELVVPNLGCWRFKPMPSAENGKQKNPQSTQARLTLRGVYWMHLPLRGCVDLVFDLQHLSARELETMGRDRKNLKVSAIPETASRAVKHLVKHIDSLPVHLKNAVVEAAQAPNMNAAMTKALSPLLPAGAAVVVSSFGIPQSLHPPPTTVVQTARVRPSTTTSVVARAATTTPAQELRDAQDELRKAQGEIERLQRLLTKHAIDYSSDAASSPPPGMPPNTTDGLTSWAQRKSLTDGAKETLDELVDVVRGMLTRLGFRDPVVTGSTARGCALRGESVDVDIAVWVPPAKEVPMETDIYKDSKALETDAAFVFKPSDGNGVVVHGDLVHKSYRQHPIDIQFFPDETSYNAQIAFMEKLCDRRTTNYAHASLLTVALKRWARNVLSSNTPAGSRKVPGWAFEMIAVKAVAEAPFTLTQRIGTGGHVEALLLTPELFVRGLEAVRHPPDEVRTGCDIDGAEFDALKKAAKRTIPVFTTP